MGTLPTAKPTGQPFRPEMGERVMLQCLDGGAWYQGEVIRRVGDQVCIKYSGWDEFQWLFLPSNRLRYALLNA